MAEYDKMYDPWSQAREARRLRYEREIREATAKLASVGLSQKDAELFKSAVVDIVTAYYRYVR